MELSPLYVVCWASACLVALGLFLSRPSHYTLTHGAYWRFLGRPWKLVTLVIATVSLALMAPYAGDPTWDAVDATFMGLLTFATAPWSVGTLYRWMGSERSVRQAFVALSLWLFSASWSYDAYLLIRDGAYPLTWWANLLASSLLYLCAGLFWSLEWRPEKGTTFAFMEPEWPSHTTAPFSRVAPPALALMLVFGLLIVAFAPALNHDLGLYPRVLAFLDQRVQITNVK